MSRERPTYDELLGTLEAELAVVAAGFDELTGADWGIATRLRPVDPGAAPWTVLELAGHLDISIGITSMLVADAVEGGAEPQRDDVDFFVFPSAEVASEFYEYAYTMVDGRSPASMASALRTCFTTAVDEARAAGPGPVGAFPGFEPYPLMRLDDFVSTRIVEAVVHGIDLTDALGRPTTATPDGVAHAAQILDQLLERTRAGVRPTDLGDDLAWVRAASGRTPHPDPRLPLLD
jgi:Mycothiol maleylpyruvate isomerase N-terminal domain